MICVCKSNHVSARLYNQSSLMYRLQSAYKLERSCVVTQSHDALLQSAIVNQENPRHFNRFF